MEEVFIGIKGFENYEISRLGNVKNILTNKIRKNVLSKHGYYRVDLYCDGKKKRKNIHNLIADIFIPNPDNKPCVDHIDRESTNNDVNNLRWATYSENMMNKSKHKNNSSGHSGISYYKANKTWHSRLMVNGKIYRKYFKTIEEAIQYRIELQQIHFGIYAIA